MCLCKLFGNFVELILRKNLPQYFWYLFTGVLFGIIFYYLLFGKFFRSIILGINMLIYSER
jgi:sensor histidine kinase YesM